MLRVVVLISGTGSNLKALIDALAAGAADARIVAVGADRAAPGLEHATTAGIETFVVDYATFRDRAAWGEALADEIARFEPDLVILSGLMRILPRRVVAAFGSRMINTHPSYLPEFPGAHAVRDALAAGATRTGASIIAVDEGVDTGAILAQERVDIRPDDTEATLHERIKVSERRLLVDTVRSIASQRPTP